jgi:hypothetical protein
MGGRWKSVREFMTSERVPKHERERWPLLVDGESILWVVGLRAAEDAKVAKRTIEVVRLRLVGCPAKEGTP